MAVGVWQCGRVDVDARDYAIIAAASNAAESQAGTWDNHQHGISLLQEFTRPYVKTSETFFPLDPVGLGVNADGLLARPSNQ
jgi:hypothetical protein